MFEKISKFNKLAMSLVCMRIAKVLICMRIAKVLICMRIIKMIRLARGKA